jgi:hypothetical protein
MKLPNMDEGKTRFAPYHSGFREAARLALTTWRTGIRPRYGVCPLRVLRTNMSQLIVQDLQTLIGGMPGVRFIETRSLRTLVVFDAPGPRQRPWAAQIKHVDEDFRTRNIPTLAALSFNAQEDFPEIPAGSVHFTFGYRMPGPDGDLLGPFVILPLNDEVVWRYSLGDAESDMETGFLWGTPTPARPMAPMVKPKPGAAARRKNSSEQKNS